jgi:hypothetical protein
METMQTIIGGRQMWGSRTLIVKQQKKFSFQILHRDFSKKKSKFQKYQSNSISRGSPHQRT